MVSSTYSYVAKVPIVVLMLFNAAWVAVLIGRADGDVLATFPNPRDVGVIAVTEAAVAKVGITAKIEFAVFSAVVAVIPELVALVARVESVLFKDVLEAPYKKS